MKKKRRLPRVVMAASVAAMGVGVFQTIDAEAMTTGSGAMCCAFDGDGCVDDFGFFYPEDVMVAREFPGDTCTNHQ
ncbi:hypothetical protein DN752_14485 [Echinicola strongylocentroti]|uniref:Secreted protein n=1 Tax=Echinicola strongylocentroti TaxID=1795355 RepID=A0A2Z4IJB0_9BACT|nr:hypothetical protein [Echinicola strongylocentroti]AWW31232.1 hypothetical protein DN752_14485 [Echinicola strongylocentroti]